jgi:hypothetical protein
MNSTESCNKRLAKTLKTLQASSYNKTDLNFEIPIDPQKFYEDFGLLSHPDTGQIVPKLTQYQTRIWNAGYKYKYRLTIKSQKVGISTSSLMEDFQRCILPPSNKSSCMGKEVLVISQTLNFSKEHLRTLRRLILQSQKYRRFLITKPTDMVLKDEVTKISVLYIKNPFKPTNPTRIIALGPREAGIWSWKEVKHIHMSDVAAINQIDDSGSFGAAMSRLINTRGTMHIETPPRGQRGKIWELYKMYVAGIHNELTEQQKAAAFHVETIRIDEAIAAGLVNKQDIEDEKERNPILYGQLYLCEFMNPYTSWYEEAMIKKEPELAKDYVST